jgi:hypothetical protein
MSLFDNIGLLDEYEEEDEFGKAGLTRFLSKPIQRQWQPFDAGTGPASQPDGPITQTDKLPTFQSHETYDPDGRWDKKFAHKPAMSFSALDEYEEADKFFTQLDGFARDHGSQAKVWKDRYEDFLENELVPFGTEMGRFETYGKDFDVDSYIKGLDNDFATNQKLAGSPDKDGLFSSGPSDETLMAREQSELWNPFGARNGIREKYERLRGEYEARQERADHFARERDYMQERLLSIPFEQKMELEELATSRKALKGSQKLDDTELDQMLGSYKWEAPRFDPKTGDILNINKIDPRWVSTYGGASTQSMARQTKRMAAAQKGDLEGFLNSRSMAERIRALRDKGYMMPRTKATHPRGLSREDEDILDIAKMREAGLTEYKGQSLEEAFQSMGGDERLRATKFLKNVYATRDAYQLAQQDFIRMAGGGDPDERNNARDAMNAARDHYHQALYTAGDAGLVSRLYEQATSSNERVGLLEGFANALKRGFKSAEMSKLTEEILLNDVQESELQNFLDASQEMEDLPGSTALQRYQEAQQANPDADFFEAVGLLFDNPKAIPEMIAESLSAFLPAYAYTAPKVIGAGAGAGATVGGLAGLKIGAGFGARLNWGVSSLAIEYSGAIMEELRELGIDTGDSQIVMAAFNSPAIMDRLKEKAYKRGIGVGGVDAVAALLAGRVGHLAKYNKLRGGKLVNADAWRKAKASVPRFTRWQRARGAAGELAAGAGAGMSGELIAQLWEREEGEALNMHAIAAEGIVDVASPMSMGGAIAQVMRNPDKMDLSTSAMEFSTPRGTNTGLTGTVTRAGMVRDWNSFERSDAAAAHLLQASGLDYDSPMGQWTQDYMARLQQLNPEKFGNIRWVLSDRTPSPDILQEGSFEYDSETGATLIYLNKEMMAKNPLRAFMHESAHFARQSMFENDEAFIKTYYAALPTKDAQLDALTEYVVKTPKAKYSQLDPTTKRQVDAVWNASTDLVRAEEWFAYQFARLLVGDSAHQSVAKPLKQFFESHIVPSFAGYMGAEEYAGTPDQQIRIGQAVLNAMGYTNNGSRMGDLETFFKYKSDVNRADNRTDLPTGYEGLTEQEGINNLKSKIAAMDILDRERAIWAVNSLMGTDILDPRDTAFQTVDQQREDAQRRSDTVLEEGGVFDQATAEVDAEFTSDDDVARANEIVKTVRDKMAPGPVQEVTERDRIAEIERQVGHPKHTAVQNEDGSITVTREGGEGYDLQSPAKTYHKTVEEARAFVNTERKAVDEQDQDTLAEQERMQKLIQNPKELEKEMYLKRKELADQIFEEEPNITQSFPEVITEVENQREANPELYEEPGTFEATVEDRVRKKLMAQVSDSEVLASMVDIEKLAARSKVGSLVATRDLAERDTEVTPSQEDIEEAYFQDEKLQDLAQEGYQQRVKEIQGEASRAEEAIDVNKRNFEKVKKRPQSSTSRPLEAVAAKKYGKDKRGKSKLKYIKPKATKGIKVYFNEKQFKDSIAYLNKSKSPADKKQYKEMLRRFKYWSKVARDFQWQKDYQGNIEAQFSDKTGKGKDSKFKREFNVGIQWKKAKKGKPRGYSMGVFLTKGDIPLTKTELAKQNERRTLLMDVFGEYLENAIKETFGGKDIDAALSNLRQKVAEQNVKPQKAAQVIANSDAFHIFFKGGPIPRFIQALIELPDMTPRKLSKLVDKFRLKEAQEDFQSEVPTVDLDDLDASIEKTDKAKVKYATVKRLARGEKTDSGFEFSAESNIFNYWYNTVLDAEKAHPKKPKDVRKYVLDRMSASKGQLEMQARAEKDKRADSVRTQVKRLQDFLFLTSPAGSRIQWADVPALGAWQDHWLKVETPQPLDQPDEDGVRKVNKNKISWRRVTLKDLIEGGNSVTAYKGKDLKKDKTIYRPTAFAQFLKDFDPKKLKKTEFRKDYLSFLTPEEYYMHLVAAEASWSNQGKGKNTVSATRFDIDGDPKDLGFATPGKGTSLIQTLAHQILKVSAEQRKRQYEKFKKDGLIDDPEGTHPFVSYNTVQSAVPTPEEEMIASILEGRVGEAFTGAAQDYDGLRSGQRMRILLHQRRRYVESLMTDTRKEGQVKIVDGQEVWGNATAYGRMYGWGDEKGKKTRRVEININELDLQSRGLAVKLGGLSKEELEKRGKDVLHPWVTKKNVTEGFRFKAGKDKFSAFTPKEPPKSDEEAWKKWKAQGLTRSPYFQTNASREGRFIALDGNKLVIEEQVPGGIPLFKLHQRLISRIAGGDMTGEMPGSSYTNLDMKKVRIAHKKNKFRGSVNEYLESMGEEMAQKRFGYRIFGKGDTTYSQSAEPTEASAKIAPSGSFGFAAGMDVTGGKYPTDKSGGAPKSQRLDPFREWQFPHRIAEAMTEYWNKEADEMGESWAGGVGSMYVWWKSHEFGNPAEWMRNKDNELMKDAFKAYWASVMEAKSDEEKAAWAEMTSTQKQDIRKKARKDLEKSLRGKDKKDQKGGAGDYPPALRSALVDLLEAREKERVGDFWTAEDDHIMDALRKHYVQGGYPMLFGDPFTQVHSTDQGNKATIKAFGNNRWRIRQDNPSFAVDEHDKFRDGIDAFLDKESPYIQHNKAFDESDAKDGPNAVIKDGNQGKDHNDFIRGAVDTPTNFVQMYAEMIGYGGVTGAGPQYFSSEWEGWHRDNLEASEVLINSIAREGIPPLTEVKFINEKGVQDSATWRGDRWVNTKNQRKVYRHAEYEASGADDKVSLENDYYRIQRAWLAEEEAFGSYVHNSLVSGLHMTPRRLIEQIMNYGVDMFMMAGNIDRGGKGTPGAPMGGLFPRVIFPLLKKFYFELGLLTEENGELIAKDEEAWKALKRFDISDPNFDSLLPDVDLSDVTDTDANKKVVVEAGAIGLPKNIIVDGGGMSEFLALKLQGYSSSNISGATTRTFEKDHPLFGLDKKEVVGRQKEGTTDFVYDNLALAENAKNADVIYVFRTKDSKGEWVGNQKIDQIRELALAQGKIVREYDVNSFAPEKVATDMADMKNFFAEQDKTMDNVWIYSSVKPNKDREADFSNIFEALETGEFTARVKAKKKKKGGRKSKKSTGGKTAKTINIKSSTKDEWSYLSNFSDMGKSADGTPKFFTVPGVTNAKGDLYRFFSVEQAYQVLKNKDIRENETKLEEAYTKVLRETHGQQGWEGTLAQKAGKGIEPTIKDDYNIKLMEELIRMRVKVDGTFRTILASTRGKKLEHNVRDEVWKKEFPRILEEARKNLTRSRFDDDWMFLPASMVGNQEWLNKNLVTALGPVARAVSNAGRHDYWNEQTDHTILEQEQGEEQNISEDTAEGAEHSTKSTKKDEDPMGDFGSSEFTDTGEMNDAQPTSYVDNKVDAPDTDDPTESDPHEEAEDKLDKQHKATYEDILAKYTQDMVRARDGIFRWANDRKARTRPFLNYLVEQDVFTDRYWSFLTDILPPTVEQLYDENDKLPPDWRVRFDGMISRWTTQLRKRDPEGYDKIVAMTHFIGPQWEQKGKGVMAPFTGVIESVLPAQMKVRRTESGPLHGKWSRVAGEGKTQLEPLEDLREGDVVQEGEPLLASETLYQYLFRLTKMLQVMVEEWEGGPGIPSQSERKNKPIQMLGSSMKPTRRGFLKSLAMAVAAPKIPLTPPTEIAQRAAFESFKKMLTLQATATKIDHSYNEALAAEEDLYHYMMGDGPTDNVLESWSDIIYGREGELGSIWDGGRKNEVQIMSRRMKNMNAETLQVYIEDLERDIETLVLADMNDGAFNELNDEMDRYNDLVMKFSKGATLSNVSTFTTPDKPGVFQVNDQDFLQQTTELEIFIINRIKEEVGLLDLERKLLKTPWGRFGTAQHERWMAAQDALHAAQKKAGFHSRKQIDERISKYVITPEIWKEFKRELPKMRKKIGYRRPELGQDNDVIRERLTLLKKAAARYKIIQAKENFEGYLKVDALMGAIKDLTGKFKKLKNLSMEDVEFIADFVDLLDKDMAEGKQILLEEQTQTTNDINIKPEVQREEDMVERPKPTDEGQQNDQLLGSSMLGNRHPVQHAGILSRLSVATDELKSWREARKELSAMKTGQGFFDRRRLTLDYVDSDLPIKQGFERMLDIAGIDRNSVVADAMNTYDKKHIYFGKGYDSVEQARVNFREPFMEAIRESGVDIETVGTWFQARNAPTRNIHHEKQYTDMLRDLKQDKKRNAKKIKEAEERGVPTSGIDTEAAIEAVGNIENMPEFQAFMNHPNNPIQKFYDMNLEDLANRTTANLVDPTEEKRMIQAASYFDWAGKSQWKPQFPEGVNQNYSYAPMQGFEGETQTLFDREEAWSLLGSPSGSSGRGFDMPRGLLKKGAFGRGNQVGPDPTFAFPAAERAYSEGVILGHKAEVVNSFADMHDAMRRIAYGAEPENSEVREMKEFQGLDLDALHKNEEVRELMKAEYNKIFKTFVRKVPKTEYDWKDEALSVEGSSRRMRVIRKEISQEFKNDPTIVVFRRMGETHYIQFRETVAGMEMAQSLKNLRYEALPELMDMFNTATRFISTMVTSKNPAFVIPNFSRDWMQAFINLGETEETKRFRGEALKPSNIYKWGKAIYESENTLNIDNKNPFDTREFKGKNPEQVAKDLLAEGDPIKMYMFAKSQGALVGYFRHKPIPELLKDQIKDAREGKIQDVKSAWDNFISWTDSLNSVAENSVRISTFWASVGAGATVQQSANSSRNVTVDFNKGGNFSMHMNALYMFFRASVNATARSWDMLKKRGFKGAMELAGNIVMTSFALNMLNRILSDEDEDDTENKYDQISHWKRDKNIVFMVPGFMRDDLDMDSENHWSLPIPLGLPAGLWAIGQTLGDMAAHVQSGGRNGVGLIEGWMRMAGAVTDMGNPFGSGELWTMLTPTVAKPVVEFYTNKDFTGRDIVYEDMWGQNTPAHTRDPARTPEFWTAISRKINEAGGGSENVKGSLRGFLGDNPAHYSEVNDVKWDIAGNHMRQALRGVFGGLFTTLEEGALLAYGAINGKAMTDGYNRIPIVSRFWSGSTYGGQTKRKFRSYREKVRIMEKELESKSDPIAKNMYQQENAKYLKYSAPAKKLESMRLRTNEEIKKVKASTTLTNVQITQRVEKLEEKWLLLAARLINDMQKQGIKLSV